jgi:hypothetical protein
MTTYTPPTTGKYQHNGSTTLTRTTHSISTFCMTTITIMGIFATLSTNDTKHANTQRNPQHSDTRHNDNKHNNALNNDTQHNDTQHIDTQHNDTQHYDTQHNNSQQNEILH